MGLQVSDYSFSMATGLRLQDLGLQFLATSFQNLIFQAKSLGATGFRLQCFESIYFELQVLEL